MSYALFYSNKIEQHHQIPDISMSQSINSVRQESQSIQLGKRVSQFS